MSLSLSDSLPRLSDSGFDPRSIDRAEVSLLPVRDGLHPDSEHVSHLVEVGFDRHLEYLHLKRQFKNVLRLAKPFI